MTLYERLGGDAAVTGLLDRLYVRALADPLLQPFLENIDIPRLREHQFVFISQALGGPHQYSGRSLVEAHARLAIEKRHFDAFVGHLRDSLAELGAAPDAIAEIMARVEPLHVAIVNTPSRATAGG
jgi:hemoglobin